MVLKNIGLSIFCCCLFNLNGIGFEQNKVSASALLGINREESRLARLEFEDDFEIDLGFTRKDAILKAAKIAYMLGSNRIVQKIASKAFRSLTSTSF